LTTTTHEPVVLITGASMGIGAATAAHLARIGCRVFGTSRQPTPERIAIAQAAGFTLVQLDVTDAASVSACVADVLARAGRIDVLVNNAGVDLVGGLEETTLEDIHWVFDTNFFGAHRMVCAVLPDMRARRDGLIINVSSALGRASWPFEGAYCASKFALEGYTETLRYELNLFNIRVSSVQPGFYRSNMINTQRSATQQIADYDPARERAIQVGKDWADDASDPAPVARMIGAIIGMKRPRVRYAVGMEAVFAPPLAHLLPARVLFKAGRWMLGVDDPRADIEHAIRQYAPGVGVGALSVALAAWIARKRR